MDRAQGFLAQVDRENIFFWLFINKFFFENKKASSNDDRLKSTLNNSGKRTIAERFEFGYKDDEDYELSYGDMDQLMKSKSF